jgi:hypothetical protein
MYYIYFLKDLNGTVKYVGQTRNCSARKRDHKKSKHPHIFEIVEQIDIPEKAKELEIFYIKKFDTYKNGWNKSTGGEGFDNYERKGIGGVKKGNIPWNKNLKNCFSEETIKQMREVRRGRVFSKKLSNEDVLEIRSLYSQRPNLENVGLVMKNGKIMSYLQAFCKKYANNYKLTPQGIKRIVLNECWKNV